MEVDYKKKLEETLKVLESFLKKKCSIGTLRQFYRRLEQELKQELDK